STRHRSRGDRGAQRRRGRQLRPARRAAQARHPRRRVPATADEPRDGVYDRDDGRSAMSARFAALAERLDDAVNPVFLKEIRQAVRGRFIVSALVLSLVAEVITVGTMYVSDELSQFRLDSAPAGPQTFAVLYSVIFIACLLFVPFYCGIRMMSERSDAN